ncbi:MAG: PilT/PilU family type 4a pilus ATPase [Gammaproteobacteria bacterium]|nr:MAG: PilT/PilU family type 4a pilus ATPase [Gammaproteobacteria bacterium]
MSQDLRPFLKYMVDHEASDLFLSVGAPPTLKIDGIAKAMTQQPLDAEQVQDLAFSVLAEEDVAHFRNELELNKALDVPEVGRFRLNLYRQRGNPALVARFIRADIPAIGQLGMPALMESLVLEEHGLVLVAGAAGSGKSTTLASMIDHRNQSKTGHILSIEDPIEFLHSHKKSIVDQREVGIDTLSFDAALRNAMREAPDVIVIGEIRDQETMRHALSYAETGHLCLSTLHASNAHQALERIINFFPEDNRGELLLDLSLHLKAIVSQRLIRGESGKRLPAVEVMLNTPFIQELIQGGRIDEIGETIARHNESGCCTFDQSLFELWKTGKISQEEALEHADSRANLSVMIRLDGKNPHSGIDDLRLQ